MQGVATSAVSVVLTMALALTPAVAAAEPAPPAPAALSGRCVKHLRTHEKVVALTFDAGGGAGGLRRILDTLASESVTATFFITGRWARTYPAKVHRIVRLGHAVGNHTNTHPAMTQLDTEHFTRQVLKAERAIRRAAGASPGPWFRFPFGLHSSRDVALVNDLGYACIQWTVDTAGWMGPSAGWSRDKVIERVMDAERPGEIVLMHAGANPNDDSTLDADALPTVIARLRADGYRFVSLDELLHPAA